MQIMNSLKNKNVKKYLVLSVLTIVILSALIFTSVVIIYNNNKKEILNNYGVEDLSESLAINEIDTKLYIYIYTLIGTNTVILLLVTIYFFLALSRNEKEVSNMRKYIKEVSNRDYNLDIKNISESSLQFYTLHLLHNYLNNNTVLNSWINFRIENRFNINIGDSIAFTKIHNLNIRGFNYDLKEIAFVKSALTEK